MTIRATEIRKGQVLLLEGELFLVTDREYIAPGNWRAINQIKLKHLTTGNTKQIRMGSGETVELAYLDRRTCTFSYMDGEHYVFMDSENYEQIHLSKDLVGDDMPYVRLNSTVKVTLHEGTPINVELPSSVVLEVTQTDPGFRGDTATNVTKPATLETGLEVRVPPYVTDGEKVKIDTRTGDFLERSNE